MISLEKVLAAAMRYPEVAYRLKHTLSSDLVVPNPFQRQVMEFVSDFVDEHGALPKEGDYSVWASGLPEKQEKGVRQALSALRRQDLSSYTPEFLAQQAQEELRKVATRTAVSRLSGIDDPEAEVFQDLADRIAAIEPLSIEGLADLSDVARWARVEDQERGWPTGMPALDRFIGGWKNELVFLMADSGVGKTTALINFGQAAALGGANVLHLSLELSLRNTAARYYRRISESDQRRYRTETETVRDEAGRWFGVAKGSIHLLYRNSYSLTPEEVYRLVQLHEKVYGPVDMLVLDYLDLLRESPKARQKQTHEQLGYASHLIRDVALDFDCAVISATQANRPAGSRNRQTLFLSDMGKSYEKVQAGDVIVGLIQTEEEEEVHQGRLILLKVRENPGRGAEIPVYMNFDMMMVADLDHPNTRRVMREEGHLPSALRDDE